MNISLKTNHIIFNISFYQNTFIMAQLQIKTRLLNITDTMGLMLDSLIIPLPLSTLCPSHLIVYKLVLS